MRDHVRILVCGDERVGKSTFIGTLIAKNFAHEVSAVMSDVHIPPEENDDEVFCTIVDSSALPRDRQQLLQKMQSADSILVLYDVLRQETLVRLDTFWLPLIEANAKNVPVVIVRNKMDTLMAAGGPGERSMDLERQMEPLEKRYTCFHVSLECSSVNQMGINQALCHARIAALYPRAPLFDTKEGKLRPLFERAMRRLFRIYDVDRDGVLADSELNAFQYHSFNLNLSEEDLRSLRTILERLASRAGQDLHTFVRRPREGAPGGFTVEGFLRLIQLFIEKKQMKAPWQAMTSHYYDEELGLSLPQEVANPPPGKWMTGHDQVLAQPAEKFLLQLFQQFSEESSGRTNTSNRASTGVRTSSAKLLTEAAQAEVFSVIPDPACAPWDTPRSVEEADQGLEGSYADLLSPPFGRLVRAPGAGKALTVDGWMAHWQMLALHSPALLRSHLFYIGFKGHAEDMLVDKPSTSHRAVAAAAATGATPHRSVRERRVQTTKVFVLGGRGCGKSRLIKALRLGDDLRSKRSMAVSGGSGDVAPSTSLADQGREGDPQLHPAPGLEEKGVDDEERLPEQRQGAGTGPGGTGGGGGVEREDEDGGWEMVVESEVPETCCGFARYEESSVVESESRSSPGQGSPGTSASCGYSSCAVTVTEVPESYTESFLDDQAWKCDLALLVFDPSSKDSLDFVAPLLANIPEDIPRLLVSCKSSREVNPHVIRVADEKCKEQMLSAVIMADPVTGEGLEGDGELRQKITDPVSKGMLPFEEQHRRAARKRKVYFAALGLALAAGLVCVVALKEQSAPAASAAAVDLGRGGGGDGGGIGGSRTWEAGVGSALRAPVRVAKRAAAAAADYFRRWRSGRAGCSRVGGGTVSGYAGTVRSLRDFDV